MAILESEKAHPTSHPAVGLLKVVAAGVQLGVTLALLGLSLLPAAWMWRATYRWAGLAGLALFTPFAYALWGTTFCLLFVVLKHLVGARSEAGSFPFYSVVVARWAFITQVSKVAHGMFVFWVMGTDFIVWWYRLLGAKIGNRVTINTVFVYDWDLLQIGDDSFIGGRSTLMGHIGQNGRVKFAPTTIGARCTIGQDTTVFAGVVMEDGAILGANSLALEGQRLAAGGVYLGVPARVVRGGANAAVPPSVQTIVGPVFLDRNESQYPPSPGCIAVLRNLAPETLAHYSREDRLVGRLADWLGVQADRIVLGAGSEGLLKTAFRNLVKPGDTVLIPDPSWPYYAQLASAAGAVVHRNALREKEGHFTYDITALLELAHTTQPSLVIVASPNNPSGNSISLPDLVTVLSALGDAAVILDEAYWGYQTTDNAYVGELVARFPKLLVIRTFSKFFGLAGIRMGFGVSGSGLLHFASGAAVYLGHNRISEALAIAALDDLGYYQLLARGLELEKRNFMAAVKAEPRVTCYPSSANFVLLRLDADAQLALRHRVQQDGLVVKFFADPPLEHCVRFSFGTPSQNSMLLRALRDVTKGIGPQ